MLEKLVAVPNDSAVSSWSTNVITEENIEKRETQQSTTKYSGEMTHRMEILLI